MDTSADLIRWLNSATRGLPHDVAKMVYGEIEAHYEDARREHELCGLSPLEAHRAAMAELGDVQATSHALHDTHLAEQRYVKAALLSIAPSIIFVLLLIIQTRLQGLNSNTVINLDFTLFLGLLTFGCVFYVLKSFKTLLSAQFSFCEIDFPIKLISGSLLVIAIATLFSQGVFNYQVAILFNDPMIILKPRLFEIGNLLELFSTFVNIAAILSLGLGWILLSDRLVGVEDSRYGLIKPLRYALLVNGFSVVSSALAVLIGSHNAGVIAVTAVVVVGTAKCALWTLLFFRAAYRGSNNPLQAI